MLAYLKYAFLALSSLLTLRGWRKDSKGSDTLTWEDVLETLHEQELSRLPLPKLEPVPWRKDTWLLLEDWHYLDIFIPRYFFCDLDSIPRFPYIYTYLKGYARTSAMVHDWLYATAAVSRAEADQVFYDFMILEGVHRYRAKLIFYAVRTFGDLFYDKKKGVLDALMAPEVRDVDYT